MMTVGVVLTAVVIILTGCQSDTGTVVEQEETEEAEELEKEREDQRIQ